MEEHPEEETLSCLETVWPDRALPSVGVLVLRWWVFEKLVPPTTTTVWITVKPSVKNTTKLRVWRFPQHEPTSYLLTTRGMFLSVCVNIVWRGHVFELVRFNKRVRSLCFNLVWVCVCVCVLCACPGRGVNKQRVPQGRVHPVDTLLEPNFLIFYLISHLVPPLDMQPNWPLLIPPLHKKKPTYQKFFNENNRLSPPAVALLTAISFLVKLSIFRATKLSTFPHARRWGGGGGWYNHITLSFPEPRRLAHCLLCFSTWARLRPLKKKKMQPCTLWMQPPEASGWFWHVGAGDTEVA